MSFLKKLNPKRVLDAVLRRRVASAIVAVLVSVALYFGYDASPEVQEAVRIVIEAILAGFSAVS